MRKAPEPKNFEGIEIINEFLTALSEKDLERLPIADDLTFDNPISGPGKGSEAYRGFMSGFLPSIESVDVIDAFAVSDRAAAHWSAKTVFGTIAVVQLFRIEGGLITESVTMFDPRPVLGG